MRSLQIILLVFSVFSTVAGMHQSKDNLENDGRAGRDGTRDAKGAALRPAHSRVKEEGQWRREGMVNAEIRPPVSSNREQNHRYRSEFELPDQMDDEPLPNPNEDILWKPVIVEHTGGGLISEVMETIISKLPFIPRPNATVINGTKLMRQVHLHGDYKADVTLVLPSYVTVFLEGTLTPTMKLAGTDDMPQGNLMAAMVLGSKADMLGFEGVGQGAVLDCSGWNSTNTTTNTSSLTGIWFNSVLGAWVRNVTIKNCGMGAPAGPRPMYGSGNIRIADCFGTAIVDVESFGSYNRGLWSQTSRVVVWNGYFHHNVADGIDFDSATSKSVAYNNVCNDNGRHGIFVEEGASYNVLVNNTCLRNQGNGICVGSEMGPSGTNENTVLANTLGPDNYPGTGGQHSSISFGGSDIPHTQMDLVAIGNTMNGNVGSHGFIQHSLLALNENIESYQDFNVLRINDSLWLNNP